MICLTLSDSTLNECVKTTEKNSKWIDAVELRLDFLTKEDRDKAYLFPNMVNLLEVKSNVRQRLSKH